MCQKSQSYKREDILQITLVRSLHKSVKCIQENWNIMPQVIWTTYKALSGGHFIFAAWHVFTVSVYCLCFVLLGVYLHKHLNPAQNTITLNSFQLPKQTDQNDMLKVKHPIPSAESRRIDKQLAHSKAASSTLHPIHRPSLERLITILTRMAFIPEAMP